MVSVEWEELEWVKRSATAGTVGDGESPAKEPEKRAKQ